MTCDIYKCKIFNINIFNLSVFKDKNKIYFKKFTHFIFVNEWDEWHLHKTNKTNSRIYIKISDMVNRLISAVY